MLEVDLLFNPIEVHSVELPTGRSVHESYRQDSGFGAFTQIVGRLKVLPLPVMIERSRVP